jgi:hypothetical protein
MQAGWLAASSAFWLYWEQVWTWGARYAADTFLPGPLLEAVRRTAGWAAFHSALVAGSLTAVWRERNSRNLRLLLWGILAFAGVCGGWRFLPRYYIIHHTPPQKAATPGLAMVSRGKSLAIAALLLIPLLRFGPRYVSLALHGEQNWADTAMNRDSRLTGRKLRARTSTCIPEWRPEHVFSIPSR